MKSSRKLYRSSTSNDKPHRFTLGYCVRCGTFRNRLLDSPLLDDHHSVHAKGTYLRVSAMDPGCCSLLLTLLTESGLTAVVRRLLRVRWPKSAGHVSALSWLRMLLAVDFVDNWRPDEPSPSVDQVQLHASGTDLFDRRQCPLITFSWILEMRLHKIRFILCIFIVWILFSPFYLFLSKPAGPKGSQLAYVTRRFTELLLDYRNLYRFN